MDERTAWWLRRGDAAFKAHPGPGPMLPAVPAEAPPPPLAPLPPYPESLGVAAAPTTPSEVLMRLGDLDHEHERLVLANPNTPTWWLAQKLREVQHKVRSERSRADTDLQESLLLVARNPAVALALMGGEEQLLYALTQVANFDDLVAYALVSGWQDFHHGVRCQGRIVRALRQPQRKDAFLANLGKYLEMFSQQQQGFYDAAALLSPCKEDAYNRQIKLEVETLQKILDWLRPREKIEAALYWFRVFGVERPPLIEAMADWVGA